MRAAARCAAPRSDPGALGIAGALQEIGEPQVQPNGVIAVADDEPELARRLQLGDRRHERTLAGEDLRLRLARHGVDGGNARGVRRGVEVGERHGGDLGQT